MHFKFPIFNPFVWVVGICPGVFVREVFVRGYLSGRYLSGGICPGVFVREVFVRGYLSGGICPGGICPADICPGGICSVGFCPDTEIISPNFEVFFPSLAMIFAKVRLHDTGNFDEMLPQKTIKRQLIKNHSKYDVEQEKYGGPYTLKSLSTRGQQSTFPVNTRYSNHYC